MIRIFIKVLLDGQAWLYANMLKLQAKQDDPAGFTCTEEMFNGWQDEWKVTTQKLVKEMEEQENNEQE